MRKTRSYSHRPPVSSSFLKDIVRLCSRGGGKVGRSWRFNAAGRQIDIPLGGIGVQRDVPCWQPRKIAEAKPWLSHAVGVR